MKPNLILKLPSELTIAEVTEFRSQFISYIDDNEEIILDGGEVNRIDTVGIQLLLSALMYVSTQKKSYIWQKPSSIIYQSVKQLGMKGFSF
jgi:anti-anti-sigma regulatory factor